MRRAGALVLLLALAILITALLQEGGEETTASVPPAAEAPGTPAGEPADETAEQQRVAEEAPPAAAAPEVPWPSGGLCGRVTDEEGRPIAGAEVNPFFRQDHAEPVKWEFAAILDALLRPRETDAEGRFLFEDLPATGTVYVDAHARGYAPLEDAIECRVAAGRTLDLGAVILPPESRVVGMVVDEAGTPIEGTEVRLWGEGIDGPAATSGADGSFVLSGLGAQACQVEVKRDGFVPNLPPFPFHVLVRGETWDGVRVVLQHGRTVRGVVLGEDRLPIAGARVRTIVRYYEFYPDGSSCDGQVETGEARSDASGSFQVRAPASEHETLLSVDADGFDPWSRPLDPRSAGIEPITLSGGPELRSVVLRPFDRLSGEAVTSTRIHVYYRDRHGREQLAYLSEPEERTERDGCCVVQAPLCDAEEKIQVRIAAPDFLEARVENVPWNRGPISVPLIRGSVVAGRVLDKNNEALEHAWVKLLPRAGRTLRILVARTAADGAFRFSGLEQGLYGVLASRHDLAPVRIEGLDVAPGQDAVGLTLVLAERTGTIFGSVVGFTGEPAARMRILAGREDNERASGMSDASGDYRIAGVPPGSVRIRLAGAMERMESISLGFGRDASAPAAAGLVVVELPSGAEQRVDLDLRRSPLCALEGTIRLNGAPAFDVMVSASPHASDEDATSAHADRCGRFSLPPFPAGPVLITASSRAGGTLERRELELAAGRVHHIDLDVRTARLEVLVLDGRSGLPAWPSEVELFRGDVGSADMPNVYFGAACTRRDGVATFTAPPAGRYLVRADSPVGDGLASEAAIVELGEGDSRRVVMRRQPFARLLVRTPSGMAESVDRFELRREDGWRFHASRSDRGADGWRLSYLPPGRFLLVALGQDDEELATLDVDLRPGEETTVELPAD
ncbi:MAG: carboxypeptidase regulatory-like domain-containing protein [Planctomycetes bacterium]|nr:carboxypeptidase regulatory-like domain-containing protein [Planctomycetota bacterium]